MVGSNAVETHYSNAGIVDRILATFDPGEEVTPDTLAPMDHFHAWTQRNKRPSSLVGPPTE